MKENLENQSEQSQNQNEEEIFYFEEDEGDSDDESKQILEKNYKELNKKFTQTSQENSKIKKELEELKAKFNENEELAKKQNEELASKNLEAFQYKYGFDEKSTKAISDLAKANKKSLEEVAKEYGFIGDEDNNYFARDVKGRSFALGNKKEEVSVSNEALRKTGYSTENSVNKISAEFGI